MSTTLMEVVIKSGLLEGDIVRELERWGLPVENVAVSETLSKFPEKICLEIQEALTEEGLVLARETDLDLVRQYLDTLTQGEIHLQVGESASLYPTYYGRTPRGGYIIRWTKEDSIEEVMTNGESFLLTEEGPVYFSDLHEYYYGRKKAFMVCTPVRES